MPDPSCLGLSLDLTFCSPQRSLSSKDMDSIGGILTHHMTHDNLLQDAQEWIAGDPDSDTQAELSRLLESTDPAVWADRMDGNLVFGTAGLRAKVEAGSNRMNRAVVIRATAGLAEWLKQQRIQGPVVVGRDARPSSQQFMADTVGVLLAAGFEVHYVTQPTPTPVMAFLAQKMNAIAAVVITASHNPPQDNGYKVYGPSAAQIIPPADTEIAYVIDQVGPARQIPSVTDPFQHQNCHLIEDPLSQYLERLALCFPIGKPTAPLQTVYTPLHGVGGEAVLAAWEQFGLGEIFPVFEQLQPDGRFPTVDFPNPEEPGALDLALSLAQDRGADAVMANDPDTDRLAVAWPRDGGWQTLTGNQIGILLADYLLSITQLHDPLVLYSIVSTPLIADLAKEKGAKPVPTLTGFKWIWNAALALEQQGEGTFLFGFEEALGYSVWPEVRDKDGISAAVVFGQMMVLDRSVGRNCWDRLEEIYQRLGRWESHQQSVVLTGSAGKEDIRQSMEFLAQNPPADLAGNPISAVVDYRQNVSDRPVWLGCANLIELSLGDRGRVLMRPSGTEPKLKVYVDRRGSQDEKTAELAESSRAITQALIEYVGLAD